MITLDTSGLLAFMNARDDLHAECVNVLQRDPGPFVLPAGILAEIAWILEARYAPSVEYSFLQDIRSGAFAVDWSIADIDRIDEIVRRYADLEVGLADAAVVACAERHGGRILSTDRRHFPVMERGEKKITVLPIHT